MLKSINRILLYSIAILDVISMGLLISGATLYFVLCFFIAQILLLYAICQIFCKAISKNNYKPITISSKNNVISVSNANGNPITHSLLDKVIKSQNMQPIALRNNMVSIPKKSISKAEAYVFFHHKR